MNTSEIRKRHPKIYSDFFSRCSYVVSAPHSFLWSGDFAGFFDGLTISQKIPFRLYLGIEENSDQNQVPDSFLAYFFENDEWGSVYLDNHLKTAIGRMLDKELNNFKIHLLSEVPLGASLGGLGALASCLARANLWAFKSRNQRQKFTSKNFLDSPDEMERELFPKAWSIARKLQTGRTLGATTYAALSKSFLPIVFNAKGNKYWAKPLDKLLKNLKNPVWPIDFGLIFSGKYVQGAAVIASAEEIKRISEERETKIDFNRVSSSPFWHDYINFLKQITNQNLYAMSDLMQKGAHENSLRYFFNTLNQYQNMLHFLEISNPEIDKIYSQIHNISNISENRVGSGAKITGVGKGGMVLFAVPFGQYRQEIEKTFSSKLFYASWRDNYETDGALIEQDISRSLYSDFIERNSYKIKIIDGQNTIIRLAGLNDLNNLGLDLIIDIYHQKILVPGKSLTSKDLPSQKSASIILYKLLSKNNFILKNSELPGSYASSRFDLQSKITSPLSKLCGLEFEISGGLYQNFTLKLKHLNIQIGLLDKIKN